MNYADFGLGTWHPKGGMIQIVNAMVSLAKELGVRFHTDAPVSEILTKTRQQMVFVLGYDSRVRHHRQWRRLPPHRKMLQASLRGYSESYWKKKVFAPSSLLFYMGIDKKLKDLAHHNLFLM